MAAKTSPEEQEATRLHYWHIDRFRELGFEPYQAAVLELNRIDWREAERLLERKCPHELVLQILT